MNNEYVDKYLTLELRKCQLKQLDILSCLDNICKKYNISYWLDSGTLLGAIRHKGFIPWDDDVDVCMLPNDFRKFKEVADLELPETLFLQTKDSDPAMLQGFAKIRDKNSFFVEFGDDFSRSYNKGIFIDIFEMKEYPKLPKKLMSFLVKRISKSNSVLRSKKYITFHTLIETPYFFLTLCLLFPVWKFLSLWLSKYYISYGLYDNVGGWFFLEEDIFPLLQVEFEGRKFFAPHNWDNYLRILYGKYMDLPPEDHRVFHAVYIHTTLNK